MHASLGDTGVPFFYCLDYTQPGSCNLTGLFSSYADPSSGIERATTGWPTGDWRWFAWRDPAFQPTIFSPPLQWSLDLAMQIATALRARVPAPRKVQIIPKTAPTIIPRPQQPAQTPATQPAPTTHPTAPATQPQPHPQPAPAPATHPAQPAPASTPTTQPTQPAQKTGSTSIPQPQLKPSDAGPSKSDVSIVPPIAPTIAPTTAKTSDGSAISVGAAVAAAAIGLTAVTVGVVAWWKYVHRTRVRKPVRRRRR